MSSSTSTVRLYSHEVLEGEWVTVNLIRTGDTSRYSAVRITPPAHITPEKSSDSTNHLYPSTHWRGGWSGDWGYGQGNTRDPKIVLFKPGESIAGFRVHTRADAFTEGNELIKFKVEDQSKYKSTHYYLGYKTLSPVNVSGDLEVLIKDRPSSFSSTFSIQDSEAKEGRNGNIIITRNGDISERQTVRLDVVGGSAKAGGIDYADIGSTNDGSWSRKNEIEVVNFAKNERQKVIKIVTYDNSDQGDKTIEFKLTPSSYSGYFPSDVAKGSATFKILDDDVQAEPGGGAQTIVNGNNNNVVVGGWATGNGSTVNNVIDNSSTTNNIDNSVTNVDNSRTYVDYFVDNSVTSNIFNNFTYNFQKTINNNRYSSWSNFGDTFQLSLKAPIGQVNTYAKYQAENNGGVVNVAQVDWKDEGAQGAFVNGSGNSDRLYAKAGWDRIQAGDGNDMVRAGNGRDVITGGKGADELHGDFGWNTYTSEKDGYRDLIVVKSDNNLFNWLYQKAGNNPNGAKADIIEGLDANDAIRILGAETSSLNFQNASAHGVEGIGIFAGNALEAVYAGGDLSLDQIKAMTTGDPSAIPMSADGVGGTYGWMG